MGDKIDIYRIQLTNLPVEHETLERYAFYGYRPAGNDTPTAALATLSQRLARGVGCNGLYREIYYKWIDAIVTHHLAGNLIATVIATIPKSRPLMESLIENDLIRERYIRLDTIQKPTNNSGSPLSQYESSRYIVYCATIPRSERVWYGYQDGYVIKGKEQTYLKTRAVDSLRSLAKNNKANDPDLALWTTAPSRAKMNVRILHRCNKTDLVASYATWIATHADDFGLRPFDRTVRLPTV
jgi:hypothetical protein